MTQVRFYMLAFILLASCSNSIMADEYARQRSELIDEIEADVLTTASHIGRKKLNPGVMKAMANVPRHAFVPSHLRRFAYDNRPLPIGYGQTISQPYIVALMTDLLEPEVNHRVLEIGTGSGYQASILAQLVDNVYSIEIIDQLARTARTRIRALGYKNITTRTGDGYNGWKKYAPFDGIIVTAAISHIPPHLVEQLAPGGRMVIPVGTRFQTQYLTLVEKDENGDITAHKLLPVAFVPFTGGH